MQVQKMELRISLNKVRLWGLEFESSGWIWLCLVVLLALVVLPWWEPYAAARKDAGASLNKASFGNRSSDAVVAACSSSKRYGCDWRMDLAMICVGISGCSGVVMPLKFEEHSRWPMNRLPTQLTIWWSRSKTATKAESSSTSKWRPLWELTAAISFLSVPSGDVPGSGEVGCGWSSSCSVLCEGPDCVFLHVDKVLFAKVRDESVFLFLVWVPNVICIRTVK